jgi:L-amino acid N-acyltransferase YncA
MSTQIRAARVDDVAIIQSIYAYHVEHGTGTFELEPPTFEAMRGRFHAIAGRNYPFLVATEEDQVIGFGYAGQFRARPAYRYTVEDSIYLHPDKLGRGTGKLLLQQLIDTATDRGFTQMLAVIGDTNNRASIRLHAKLGFSTTGTLQNVGFKFDRWLDVVLMQRSLATPAM